MPSIDPNPGAFSQALKDIPADTPVVMLNLLRFREQASYADDSAPCSGRDAYAIYSKNAFQHLQNIGAEVIWWGDAKASIIAPEGEQWDEVLMVRYPSIQKFVEMVTNPDYQAFTKHRTAALQDARLIANVERK